MGHTKTEEKISEMLFFYICLDRVNSWEMGVSKTEIGFWKLSWFVTTTSSNWPGASKVNPDSAIESENLETLTLLVKLTIYKKKLGNKEI